MYWKSSPSDPKKMLEECIAAERIRYSGNLDELLRQHDLSRLRVLKQLKRSKRAEQHDYFKGNDEIPCYAFVARMLADIPALTFIVSFEQELDGSVYLWIQEFHL